MKSTDRVLSNISAIKTLLENFPDDILDGWNGKTYTSSLEFIIDILRCCGISDKVIIEYLIGKIYGFEGQPGYTINGLYELLKSNKLTVDPQNNFVSGIEYSIKVLLMSLFTSIFTCSALPILPNKVFDLDELNVGSTQLMSNTIQSITKEGVNQFGQNNDYIYKLKFPIKVIDIIDMMHISPVSSYGSLYYTTNGKDHYYKNIRKEISEPCTGIKTINPGDTYKASGYTFEENVFVFLENIGGDVLSDGEFYEKYRFFLSSEIDDDVEIMFSVIFPGKEEISTARFFIAPGNTADTESSSAFFYINPKEGDKSAVITDITINGFKGGCETTSHGKKTWLYLFNDDNLGFRTWKEHGGIIGGNVVFGYDRSDETYEYDAIATTEMTMEVVSARTYYKYVYESLESKPKNYIRCATMPTLVTEDSPEYIVCYEGDNPNLLYTTYDMNAFIWYVMNRGKKSNREEKNHLMWDSRISAREKGVERSSAEEWNNWYSSKSTEGSEFNLNGADGEIYPIIQLEKFGGDEEILIRIPSQRYFLPQKREDLLNGNYDPQENKKYFNASVYKFDWDYLQNIQILNPRLLLVRFIENLFGLSIEAASTVSMNLVKSEIKAKLATAVKSIIEADDMEVSDCYNVFSNDDFDNLLNEMLLQRYTATKHNGEVVKARQVDIDEITSMLDSVNSNASTVGNVTQIKRMVNEIVMTPGVEPSTKYNFEFGFDSNLLNNLIWAIVMPIVESLFTPQVMLIVMINFDIMGIVDIDEALGNDFGKICNLLINKILGFVKSIVKFIKDKIVSILIDLLNEKILPLIEKYMLMIYLEHITDWLVILLEAVRCLPLMSFGPNKIGFIEDVDYADIYKDEETPESQSEC